MLQIVIGIIVWLVLPLFFSGRIKKKSDRKAMAMLCKILGFVLIIWGVFSYLSNVFWEV